MIVDLENEPQNINKKFKEFDNKLRYLENEIRTLKQEKEKELKSRQDLENEIKIIRQEKEKELKATQENESEIKTLSLELKEIKDFLSQNQNVFTAPGSSTQSQTSVTIVSNDSIDDNFRNLIYIIFNELKLWTSYNICDNIKQVKTPCSLILYFMRLSTDRVDGFFKKTNLTNAKILLIM